ncbi:MAG: hypothetical protein LAT51_12845, partial [Flavobacteriaceae bacterium]|nr:hypothetical protein [Flavobacteriaceae bacterium]
NNPLNLVDPDGLFPNDPPGVNPIIKAGLNINFGGKDTKTQYNFEAGLGAIFDKPIDLNNKFKQSLTFMVKTNDFFSSNASYGIEVKTTYTNDRYVDKLSIEMKEYLPFNNVDGQNPQRFSLSGSYTFNQGLDVEQAPLFDNKIGFKASTEDGMEYSFFGETRGSSDVNFNIKPKLSFEVTSRTFENFEFNSDFKFENLQLKF